MSCKRLFRQLRAADFTDGITNPLDIDRWSTRSIWFRTISADYPDLVYLAPFTGPVRFDGFVDLFQFVAELVTKGVDHIDWAAYVQAAAYAQQIKAIKVRQLYSDAVTENLRRIH